MPGSPFMKSMVRKSFSALACVLSLAAGQSFAFGPKGHAMIGAIADKKLEGTKTAAQLAKLLNGMPLAKAALIADDIKDFNATPDALMIAGQPELTKHFIAFLKANPHTDKRFDHHS